MSQTEHGSSPKGKNDSRWQSTPTPHLIRYMPKGTYYVRVRIAGRKQPFKQSLGTTNYGAAKVLLVEKLAELKAGRVTSDSAGLVTLHDALDFVRAAIATDPSLKADTRTSYFEEMDALKRGKPAEVPETPLARLTGAAMAQWWSDCAKTYAPQRANHLLMFVRRAVKLARKSGALFRDPTEDLKRLKIPRTRLTLLTPEQFSAVVLSVRSQGRTRGSRCREAADWIEFMTYCGLRPAEVSALRWEDLDEAKGIIRVWGKDDGGTKNREPRLVPMISAILHLIARMRDGRDCVGRIFTLQKPHEALTNACKRLGFPHQRIYDLRHTFATMCNAAGVDVPTFAKWLGHKDGGALAMKTYVHPDEEHSLRSAKKVKF